LMARRYGRCCMYGPNYVKLSRVFAVKLFSMFIGHYAATPGPIRPPLAPQPCHHRLHSPHPHPCTATPTARDSNLDSGNQDMSRLSTPAYPNDAPIHGLTDMPLRLLSADIGCGTHAPVALDKTRQHPLLATQTSVVATKTCLGYLHSHTRTMRPSTASPICLYAWS
jgi:hypothetical protein